MAQVKKNGTKQNAAAPAPAATTTAKGGAKTVLEQTFRSVSWSERCLARWIPTWEKLAKIDESAMGVAGLLQGAVNQIGSLKAHLEKMHTAKWVAPKVAGLRTGVKAPELAVDTRVWIRDANREEYLAVFTEKDLSNLFIDKMIGKKILVRIGARAEGGKVARIIGFTPKGHLTTVEPKKAEPKTTTAPAGEAAATA